MYLKRGNYDQPGEEVTPSTPAAILPFLQNTPRNRLGLAEWYLIKKSTHCKGVCKQDVAGNFWKRHCKISR